MTKPVYEKDLVVLTADKNAQYAIRGILARHLAINIRPVEAELFVHPEKDPGILLRAHEFLRSFTNKYNHAIVVMDREGCGQDDQERSSLERKIQTNLQISGWDDRAIAIVIDPELDIWVWSDSPHVERILGWEDRQPNLRSWLLQNDFFQTDRLKPARPKEALESALRQVRKPRSSAIYEELAKNVSTERCTDPAFTKLRDILRQWFSL
jgi:hypothetical protein